MKYLETQEKTRRYRLAHTEGYKRDASESSLDNILEIAERRGGDDSMDAFWFQMGAYHDDMNDRKLECDGYAIEVLRRLTSEELGLVLLRNLAEFSLSQIAIIVGCSYTTAWQRWARVRGRLTEIQSELSAADPLPE